MGKEYILNTAGTDLFGASEDKAANAIDIIQKLEPSDGYYVAFSGGKDSIVTLDLVRRAGVKYDAHYNIGCATNLWGRFHAAARCSQKSSQRLLKGNFPIPVLYVHKSRSLPCRGPLRRGSFVR
jgi:hypothetical protein